MPKIRVDPKNHAVLVTGCDTGFGNLLARKLDKAGFKVLACCLFPDGSGAKELKAECSSKLSIIKLDVTSDKEVEAAYQEVESQLEASGNRKWPTFQNNNQISNQTNNHAKTNSNIFHPTTRTELLAVVNNAGILATGEVEFGKSLEPFEKQLEVNCLGTIRVTKAFCPLLRRCQKSPRLVNVTSLAARISLPGECRHCF